nr:TIGR03560 family F420-dependent LLM class oxidoreductase [Chloroflexia bacterium]
PQLLADTARAADEGGVSTMTVMDHYFQIPTIGQAEEPMLEGYTTLGFLAGQTRNLRLSLLVTGVTYRYPALLAKIITTLDVLSGGRAMLGLGAAWFDREHHALGVPYPPTAERFKRLEETLQICKQMWSDNNGPYTGKHYQLAETLCSPLPIQSSGPPIMIGGMGNDGHFAARDAARRALTGACFLLCHALSIA